MNEDGQFAITLYLPDATLRALREDGGLRGVIVEGVPELNFLPPPGWWEGAHAARLGLVISDFDIRLTAPGESKEPCSQSLVGE